MLEWFVLVVLVAMAWLWMDSHRALDIARASAREFCLSQGLQLLDDTVASTSLKLERNSEGRLTILRTYRFEFSDTGDNRLAGSMVMLGHKPGPMHLQAFTAGE